MPDRSDYLVLDPKLIDPNPWQPRVAMPPETLAELADSIRAKGLLQPPQVRRSPRHAGRFELAFGHRRFAAWQLARPGLPFPCELVHELSDREMAEAAATENAHRQDLNPVERARGLKRLIGEFGLTQAEAGKLYGLATQGAVSNAVRLLELPDKILEMVIDGRLAEKYARFLIVMGRVDRAEAMRTAEMFVKGLKDETADEETLVRWVSDFYRKHGKSMERDAVWPADWAPKDQEIRVAVKGGDSFNAPACKGCEFFWRGRWESYCLRPACFQAKAAVWANEEAAKASKRLGIKQAVKGGLAQTFYTGQWNQISLVTELLKRKPEHLRLVAYTGSGEAFQRAQHLGSRWVALASTDAGFLEKLKEKQSEARQERESWRPDPAKEAREKAERARRYQVDQVLIEKAAGQLVGLMPTSLQMVIGLSKLIEDALPWADQKPFAKAIEQTKRLPEAQRLVLVAMLAALHDVNEWRAPEPGKLRGELADLAKSCKVKLAPGWDAVPAELPPAAASTNGKKAAAKKAKAKK